MLYSTGIEFSIQQGDITSFSADVVALKHAQYFNGADSVVAGKLHQVGIALEEIEAEAGEYRYVRTRGAIAAPHALFVGVVDLIKFAYQQIREFSAKALEILVKEAPYIRHLAMTIHGVGYGLDENEALLAQFAGYLDAIQSGLFPPALEKISIVEIEADRVKLLRLAFEKSIRHANYISKAGSRWAYRIETQQTKDIFKGPAGISTTIKDAGRESEAKPHVFVAMPFMKEMDDVFYYGIQQPVRAAGFLCERVDQEAFLGDILDRVKKRIETSSVVIAELSGANPNVYLEIGYAWGKGRPTILLVRNEQELRFDVRSQRCLKYERIQDLERALEKEMRELKLQGSI